MVLFYSTFIALKRQDSAGSTGLPTALIEDPRDMEEELLFSGTIHDREMFHVLRLLQDIARHLKVPTAVTPAQIGDLMKKTDLDQLTDRMEELAEPATSTDDTSAEAAAEESPEDAATAATR